MRLDQAQEDLFCAIANDENRTPHSMPGWYYSDQRLFELEKNKVFADGWVCVGHQSEISKIGQYVTATIGDEPIVILRDRQKQIRAFSNICRHRGMTLVDGKGKASLLTCPYHAWSYQLDGQLFKAPYMDAVEGFDPTVCALPEFKLEVWLGFMFVNISGVAAPLAPQLADLEPFLKNYHAEDRHSTQTWHEEWQTNWKALVENFMEGYHLSVTHATTLDYITPTELCEKLASGEGFTAYRSNYRPSSPQRLPFPADLTSKEQRSSVLVNIYPNFVITVGPNCAVFLILLPVRVESVVIKMGVLVQDGSDDLAETKAYIDLAHAFNAEDKATLEAIQKNAKTNFRPIAHLAPEAFEGTIWDFTRQMARLMISN